MDRRGKERLIGAGILVALAVAVVPELLSGPKPAAPVAEPPRLPVGAPDPVRNVTMDLTTSKPTDPAPPAPQAAPAPTPTATASATESAAGAAAAADVEGTEAEARSVQTPGNSAPADAAPAPPPVTAAQARPAEVRTAAQPGAAAGLAVQLGSFANRSNAENLLHQLQAQGYAVYESTEGSAKSTRYRVRVGPFSDRDSAERTMAKLKASGHASTLVGPH